MGQDLITLACAECKRRNYHTTRNKRSGSERLERRKYCRWCKGHKAHKETK